ncbi:MULTISPECIES: hypothetical protein [Alcanivorax]|uniref:hypothetical protein n=1 Tax=Alcanivorax TaxID=59753 RepID=UPI002637338F|nr:MULTISPECIES: hypothetical protein [Alcanivorax]
MYTPVKRGQSEVAGFESEYPVKILVVFNKNYRRRWQTKLAKAVSKGLQLGNNDAEPTHKEGERYDRQ